MNYNFELSPNVMAGEGEAIPKAVVGAIEWIQKLFRRVNREHGIHSEKSSARQYYGVRFQQFLRKPVMLTTEPARRMPGVLPGNISLTSAREHRAMNERHRPLQGIPPAQSVSTSLEQTISNLGGKLNFGTAAQLRILVTGKPRTLAPSLQGQIYLVVQEAVLNAFHHSGATVVEVRIEYLPRRVWVSVRDNGCGFDADRMRFVGYPQWDLRGMRDRAGSAGAQLRIWSKAGAGTEIQISAPTDIPAVQSV